MSEQIFSGEKEPAQLEDIKLGNGISALVLRRKDTAIGSLAYTAVESPKGATFNIQYLAIEKKDRSPGVLLKLFDAVKKHCEENDIHYVSWVASDEREAKLLNDLGAETFENEGGVHICFMPISSISAEALQYLPFDTGLEIHEMLRARTFEDRRLLK